MTQITPKALSALQKLLSMPGQEHRQFQEGKSHQWSQQHLSGSQQNKEGKSLNRPYNKPLGSPSAQNDPTVRSSVGKSLNAQGTSAIASTMGNANSAHKNLPDVKNELIHVLRKTTTNNHNLNGNSPSAPGNQLKKQSSTLNQLLQPHYPLFGKQASVPFAPKEPQLSGRDSYKKRRPPQLTDLGESGDSNHYPVQSAKHAKSPLPKSGSVHSVRQGFFTSANGRNNSLNVFGSLNEVLRQYIQAKSQKQAGTGEGVRIAVCQSARNAEKQQQERSQQQQQKHQSEKKGDAAAPKHQAQQMLQELYLKTSKILAAYRDKEQLWKQQKKSLRDEVKFLKLLLKHQEELNFQSKN